MVRPAAPIGAPCCGYAYGFAVHVLNVHAGAPIHGPDLRFPKAAGECGSGPGVRHDAPRRTLPQERDRLGGRGARRHHTESEDDIDRLAGSSGKLALPDDRLDQGVIQMGPLKGFRFIEMAGIGPGPFCGMLLSDLGAQVLRIERHGAAAEPHDPLQRNRLRLALDLKDPRQVAVLLDIVEHADALFEGYRPGVAERLGFGPDECLHRNEKLVYGRMTGWGQDGPLASTAGHDINYIALSGALHAIGRRGERPVPPLNLVGDFGGGGMFLAFGMVCALLERERSGQGQVVDAAMVDGSIALMAMFLGMQAGGASCNEVGGHFLSGAAHYYDTYRTKDDKFMALGALEPQFYAEFVSKAGLDPDVFGSCGSMGPAGHDPRRWAELKPLLASQFMTRTRDEWCALFAGSDACVAPVLTLEEAVQNPHNQARQAFVTVAGVTQNAPAPRFSRTPAAHPELATADPTAVHALLSRWGCSRGQLTDIANLAVRRGAAAGGG